MLDVAVHGVPGTSYAHLGTGLFEADAELAQQQCRGVRSAETHHSVQALERQDNAASELQGCGDDQVSFRVKHRICHSPLTSWSCPHHASIGVYRVMHSDHGAFEYLSPVALYLASTGRQQARP